MESDDDPQAPTCISYTFGTISVNIIGLVDYGSIYALYPEFSACNQSNLDSIKLDLCNSTAYKDRFMCRCINFKNNRSYAVLNDNCIASKIASTTCDEINDNAFCNDPYCINPFSNKPPLTTQDIDNAFSIINNGVCSSKKSCQTIINIDGYNPNDFTKNICETEQTVDYTQQTILSLCNLFGIGISSLLVVLYILYFYRKRN